MNSSLAAPGRRTGWSRLGVASAGVLLTWLVLLPRLADQPTVRARIEHLESHGIDPGALFYTDLERMPEWERKLDAAVAGDPDAFWAAGR